MTKQAFDITISRAPRTHLNFMYFTDADGILNASCIENYNTGSVIRKKLEQGQTVGIGINKTDEYGNSKLIGYESRYLHDGNIIKGPFVKKS